jgi:hypothetical protein
LGNIGADLGATIKLDLTSDVTHLIVGSIDSAKYRYVARCREDVKVLSPSWLESMREIWLEGHDDLDVAALEAEHRVPTFFGLKICLTGFDNRMESITRPQYNADEAQPNNDDTFRRRSTRMVRSTMAISPRRSRISSQPPHPARNTSMLSTGG